MECETCLKMTDWYLKENPEKRGYVLCESCYEKSKEYIVYMNFPYQPERSKREDPTNFYPEIMKEIEKKQDKMIQEMLGCGALNSMET